jgi:hypothetical protein
MEAMPRERPMIDVRLVTVLWTVILFLLGLLGGWAPGFILDLFPAVILLYIWMGIGVALAIVTGILSDRRKHHPTAIYRDPGILLICLAIGLGYWFEGDLARYGDRLHYRTHRTGYRVVVDSVAASSPHRAEWTDPSVGSFVVDTGPPVRVAFVRSSWLNDWEGIIFDPTDSLVSWQEHAPHQSVRLFGRAVVGCSRREPLWFDCGTLPDREKP